MTLFPELERELHLAVQRQGIRQHRRTLRRRRGFALALVTGAAAGGGAAAIAVVASHSASDPRIAAKLSVLRRERTAADDIPQKAISRLEMDEADDGVQQRIVFTDARRVRGTLSGWTVWIAPTSPDGAACLLVQPPEASGPAVGSCFRLEDLDDGAPPATSSLLGGQHEVEGIVPDGVDIVKIDTADGASHTIRAEDNVYLTTTSLPVTLVAFDGPNGHVAFKLPTPRGESGATASRVPRKQRRRAPVRERRSR
jgi:hypothetical protein